MSNYILSSLYRVPRIDGVIISVINQWEQLNRHIQRLVRLSIRCQIIIFQITIVRLTICLPILWWSIRELTDLRIQLTVLNKCWANMITKERTHNFGRLRRWDIKYLKAQELIIKPHLGHLGHLKISIIITRGKESRTIWKCPKCLNKIPTIR